MQDCGISIAWAMEIPQSCTKLFIQTSCDAHICDFATIIGKQEFVVSIEAADNLVQLDATTSVCAGMTKFEQGGTCAVKITNF